MAKRKSTDGKLYGWHFVKDDGRTGKGDIKVIVGAKLVLPKGVKPKLCYTGFHASLRLIDALRYAPGDKVCYVELSGEIIEGDDKVVASERKVIWMADAKLAIKIFAIQIAERALIRERKAGRVRDERLRLGLKTAKKFLLGKASLLELENAGAAANAAKNKEINYQNRKLEKMLLALRPKNV